MPLGVPVVLFYIDWNYRSGIKMLFILRRAFANIRLSAFIHAFATIFVAFYLLLAKQI
jgi:hypothetical protein